MATMSRKATRFRMFSYKKGRIGPALSKEYRSGQSFLAIGLTMDLTETRNRAWNVSATQCQFSLKLDKNSESKVNESKLDNHCRYTFNEARSHR